MDLLDFESEKLYFDEAMTQEVSRCLQQASEQGGSDAAETALLRAYFLEPEHPMVLVALYRYFYYQHQFERALTVAERVIQIFAKRLALPQDWRKLTVQRLGSGVMVSMTLLRFYLLALKGAGYLELRLGRIDSALVRLEKVAELDSSDRLGARALIKVVKEAISESPEFLPA